MLLKIIARYTSGKSIPLRLVLLVPFILQIFTAVGITGYLSIRNGQKAVSDVATQLFDETSYRVNQQINVFLNQPIAVNQTIATAISEGLIPVTDVQVLEHFYWSLLNQNILDFTQTGTPQGTSVLVERTEQGFFEVRTGELADLPNRRIYRFDHQGIRSPVWKTQKFDPRTRPWYRQALKAGKPVWGKLFVSATGPIVSISLSQPIYSKAGRLLAVQNSSFRIPRIGDFLQKVKIGRTGQAFVMDRAGNLIASSVIAQPYIIEGKELKQISAETIDSPVIRSTARALRRHFGNFSNITGEEQLNWMLGNQQQFVKISPLRDQRGIDWLTVIVIPESDFMAEIEANTRVTILLCLVALFSATILGIFTSRWIAQPILRLSQVSEAVADGVLDQTVESFRIRELEILSYSFNRMIQQLRESFMALEQTNSQLEQRVEERTSELKNTLKELQEAQTQIIQAEKMSSLGQLVAGVAHEINNPINFIHGNVTHLNEYTSNLLELVQLYQKEFPIVTPVIQSKMNEIDLEFLSEDAVKLLASMQVGTERIREIVKSLRVFSRLDEAEMKKVDIHEGIESTLLILQHRFLAKAGRPGIQITRNYGSLPLVECYAGQLNQVFMNVLANAIDALEETSAKQSCQQMKNNPSCIKIVTTVINSGWVEVAIANNGTGISEQIQKRIFDPFFTTKSVGKGTGLGMSISYQIITKKHNGQLKCISSMREGTTFLIQIPIHQQKYPPQRLPQHLGWLDESHHF